MSGLLDGELETASQMAAAVSAGEVSAIDLVERALARARSWQPLINAFSQLWADQALEEARRIDRTKSKETMPAGGIPIAVKDLFDVVGHETTGCCAVYAGSFAEHDGPLIARVRRAGTVLIGKTNQHELAAGGTNLESVCGRTSNPWDFERMTGGSSGGSAAVVATGIVPWALGSDTGGSIRIPASMCGAFGLKPTTGTLPLDGMMPLAPSMDCPGALATTAGDLGLIWKILGAFGSAGRPSGPVRTMRPFRLGVLEGFFVERVHHEVVATVQNTAHTLESAGIRIEMVDGHGIEDAHRVSMSVCTAEFVAAHPMLQDPEQRKLLAPSVVKWLEKGATRSEEELAAAALRRAEIRHWYLERLNGLDAVLIPTTPYPALRADQDTVDLGAAGIVRVDQVSPGLITCSVNLAGLPALNLPAGRSSEGMPIGVSLVGSERGEETLLQLAGIWEEASGYRPQIPAR